MKAQNFNEAPGAVDYSRLDPHADKSRRVIKPAARKPAAKAKTKRATVKAEKPAATTATAPAAGNNPPA